jgi:hypothetical protein
VIDDDPERPGPWDTNSATTEPEVFDFPEGMGPVECVNVEHEEVLLMPRDADGRDPAAARYAAPRCSATRSRAIGRDP